MKLKFYRILPLLPAFVLLFFSSCSNDDMAGHEPVRLSIVPSLTELQFDAAQSRSAEFKVITDADNWDVVSDSDWFDIKKTDEGFTVLCDVNSALEGRGPDTLAVICEGADSLKITVSQNGLQIYMAGNEDGVAAYWHNGEKKLIGVGSTYVNDMYVAENGDVHIVGRSGFGEYFNGFYWNSNSGWKDIIGSISPENPINVSGVAVDENTGDVYYSSYEGWTNDDFSQTWVSSYVKNFSDRVALTEEGVSQSGRMLVREGVPYVIVSMESSAGYVKGSEFVALESLGESVYPSGMQIHNGKVYVCGFYLTAVGDEYIYAPCYWIDGKAFAVSAQATSQAFCIFVDEDGNIWLGGSDGSGVNRAAAYWKNGEKTLLSDTDNACVSGIFAGDGVVIAAGFEKGDSGNSVLKYWIDGVETAVTDGSSDCYSESAVIR